jgi:hypothetical protein
MAEVSAQHAVELAQAKVVAESPSDPPERVRAEGEFFLERSEERLRPPKISASERIAALRTRLHL